MMRRETHRRLPNRSGWVATTLIGLATWRARHLGHRYNPEELRRLAGQNKALAVGDDERGVEDERRRMLDALIECRDRLQKDSDTVGGVLSHNRRAVKRRLRDIDDHIDAVERAHWHDIIVFRFCPVVLDALTEVV